MIEYKAAELSAAFRTVRKNTLTIAEEIPEEHYEYRPTPESRSVRELLAHIAVAPGWQAEVHGRHMPAIATDFFLQHLADAAMAEHALKTKDQVTAALRDRGEEFAAFLDGLPVETLAERVSLPPPLQPSSKTRFEMLLGVKEHEMHHRGQLTVYQRLLGIVPHLTRARQSR